MDIAKESREEELKIEEDSQKIQQNKEELANKRKHEKFSQDYSTVPVMIAMIKIWHQKSSYFRTILNKVRYRGKMILR